MYDDTMTAIHDHLIQKSFTSKMTYTAELIPERNQKGEMYVRSNFMDGWANDLTCEFICIVHGD